MKFFKKWGWIVLWATLSIIFAIIIHLLFKIPAPTEFWEATWSAGDILTYISTVALGLLALWQTQKLYYESQKTEKYNLAVEKYVLFEFLNIDASFYCAGNSIAAKTIHNGYNGKKAVWKIASIQQSAEFCVNIIIKNISAFPAISPQICENGKKADYCNVLCGTPNDRHYIPPNEEGQIIINLKLDSIKKEYSLQFHNPFGTTYEQKITISNADNDIIIIDGSSTLSILEN